MSRLRLEGHASVGSSAFWPVKRLPQPVWLCPSQVLYTAGSADALPSILWLPCCGRGAPLAREETATLGECEVFPGDEIKVVRWGGGAELGSLARCLLGCTGTLAQATGCSDDIIAVMTSSPPVPGSLLLKAPCPAVLRRRWTAASTTAPTTARCSPPTAKVGRRVGSGMLREQRMQRGSSAGEMHATLQLCILRACWDPPFGRVSYHTACPPSAPQAGGGGGRRSAASRAPPSRAWCRRPLGPRRRAGRPSRRAAARARRAASTWMPSWRRRRRRGSPWRADSLVRSACGHCTHSGQDCFGAFDWDVLDSNTHAGAGGGSKGATCERWRHRAAGPPPDSRGSLPAA